MLLGVTLLAIEVVRLRLLVLVLVLMLMLVLLGVAPTSTVVPGANALSRTDTSADGRCWVVCTKMRPRS